MKKDRWGMKKDRWGMKEDRWGMKEDSWGMKKDRWGMKKDIWGMKEDKNLLKCLMGMKIFLPCGYSENRSVKGQKENCK